MPIWVYVLDYILGIVMYTLIGRAAMNIFQKKTLTFFHESICQINKSGSEIF